MTKEGVSADVMAGRSMSAAPAIRHDDDRLNKPAPERKADGVEAADQLATFLWGEAQLIRWHDADMRRLNAGMAPGRVPDGDMMPEYADRYRNMLRAAKALTTFRDRLIRERDSARFRQRGRS
jgi:hypothetical protein